MSQSDHIWRTKDGREIKLSEMTDTHLLRTLRLLIGRIVDLGLQVPRNKIEVAYREDSIEQSREHLVIIQKEVDRRKLSDWGKFGIKLASGVSD